MLQEPLQARMGWHTGVGMSLSKKIGLGLLALLLALAIFAWFALRGDRSDIPFDDVVGTDPTLQEPEAETIPTVAIADPVGWDEDETPTAAEGLRVQRFHTGLDHPRTLYALPNGDILVSLTRSPNQGGGGLMGWIADKLLTKAGATGPSANQVVLLRDSDGDGVAETRHVLLDNLDSPSGLTWENGTLYVANHDEVLAFPYELGARAPTGEARKVTDLAGGGGHWMRNLELHPDGGLLYVAVGSDTNIGDKGMEAEEGRALIWEIDLQTNRKRQFAGGLRNPNGLDFDPWSGDLWTTVNERDMLGSDLVPDYLTNVPLGAQYGWPWVYYGDNYDRRVEAPIPDYINYVRTPEYALGPHVAALGFVFSREGAALGETFSNGAFVAQHGSWNRKPPSGYDVVYVPFDANGNPQGKPIPVLTGFLKDNGDTRGRPTWVEWASDGSLLISDDTAGIIWRVSAPGASRQGPIKGLTGDSLPPQRELTGATATFGADDYARERPAN